MLWLWGRTALGPNVVRTLNLCRRCRGRQAWISRDRQRPCEPVLSVKIGSSQGISEVYSFIGIIASLILLGDIQCDTDEARGFLGNSVLLCLKLMLLWDIHGHILHHHWILKTGYEQFFLFTCWGSFFCGILERVSSQFDLGSNFKAVISV